MNTNSMLRNLTVSNIKKWLWNRNIRNYLCYWAMYVGLTLSTRCFAQGSDYSFVQTGPCAVTLTNHSTTRSMVAQIEISKIYKNGSDFDSRNYLLKPSTQEHVNCADSSSPQAKRIIIDDNRAIYVEGSVITRQVKILSLVTRQDSNQLTALVDGKVRTFDCSHTIKGNVPPNLKDDVDSIYFLGRGDVLSLDYVRVSKGATYSGYAVVLSWSLIHR